MLRKILSNTMIQIVLSRTVAVACIVLIPMRAECASAEPTLARLSFWVAPGQMAAFEAAYLKQVVPILKRHGYVASTEQGRATPDSIFARLFEVDSPAKVPEVRTEMQTASTWKRAFENLGTFAGKTHVGPVKWQLDVYRALAGPGKSVPAGQGRGNWRTYDAVDGIADPYVQYIFQDKKGMLWFGTRNGLSRYDGRTFQAFTTQDGLAGNFVRYISQDNKGLLWFGTPRGVSRFDGTTFHTFTTEDGLAHNNVQAVFQDRAGTLWFGTSRGLSHYDGETFKTFTQRDGMKNNNVWRILQDDSGMLWFATLNGGVSQYDGNTFTNFTTQDGLAHNRVQALTMDKEGDLWFSHPSGHLTRYNGKVFTTVSIPDALETGGYSLITDTQGDLWLATYRGLGRYDGQNWRTFTTKDGLTENRTRALLQDREGYLWIGTLDGGVSRYDMNSFTTFSKSDGLAEDQVFCVMQDRDGIFWFGHRGAGISRYDGQTFTTWTTKDGLARDFVMTIFQDRAGNLWFGTDLGRGVTRYDGKVFTTFSIADGLTAGTVRTIFEDQEGRLWFGTEGGLSCYDGNIFKTFTNKDGWTLNWVRSITQDAESNLWFATSAGVGRYDGHTFTTLTTKDGLVHNLVNSVVIDHKNHIWFGTNGGVSRYDGQRFTSWTQKDGLAHNHILSVLLDRENHLWFGTKAGVNRYDGHVFQTLLQADGLPANSIHHTIIQDNEGHIWFSTQKGAGRYQKPLPTAPQVFLDAVVAGRRYKHVSELAVSSSTGLLTFEFHGNNFKTRMGAMVYRHRLAGYDKAWHTTQKERAEYENLPYGNYTFEVQAVDRDLVYSETPATLALTVHPPYDIIGLGSVLAIALIGLSVSIVITIKRRQERDRARDLLLTEAEEELQTARDMQMSLMPTVSPRVAGFDIAGRCIPASQVGGDFFQYYDHSGKLSLALADVTGHAMAAAIPVVLFNGVLESQMQRGDPVQVLFGELNNTLHRVLDNRTFVCFTMGEIDLQTRMLRIANGGCPSPYHFQSSTSEIVELETGAYPLGVRAETNYDVLDVQLETSDYLIFCSDGIAEAENESGEQFGYASIEATIRQACVAGLSAEATIDRILEAVTAFSEVAPQGDDMTCVVTRVVE